MELPVIIHCVRAYDEVLKELLAHKIIRPVIFHGYNGNKQQSERLLREKNIFFSFGELIFKRSKAREMVGQLPLNRVFIESDCSALPLEKIYEQVALLCNIDIEKLANIALSNAQRVWGDIFNVE
jgi:TatD DNase family protein